MQRITLRCYGDLADLAGADRDGLVRVPMGSPRPLGDVTASIGIPHTEVDLAIVDGTPVGWDHHVVGGERVALYPPFAMLPAGVVSRVRPPTPRPLRFAADTPLAGLARLLRGSGLDTWHAADATEDELVARAVEETRVLLSRDPRPLLHPAIVHGILLRSAEPREQLLEVTRRTRRGRCT